MPSKSKAQHNFMKRAAHDAEFAKQRKIPQKVAKEYYEIDMKMEKDNPGWYESLPEKTDKTKPDISTESLAATLLW